MPDLQTWAVPVLATLITFLIVAVVVLLFQLSQLRRARRALKKSEARFKDLAECAADFFWEEDANGVVTFVSERVSDILGVPPEFFLGRAFDTWLHHETPGAGASEAKAAILKHLPYRQAEIQIDLPAEARWIRGSGNPVFSENGLFQGYRGACTDITAEKKTRDQIIHERNRAQGFLEMAGSMIVVIDRDGRIMEINRRCVEVLGRKKRDLLGRNWFDVAIPPEFRDEICDVHAKIIRGDLDRVAAYENEIVTRTGERRVIQWINSFIYDNDGTITATISSGEDVTEWLASRRALRDSEERFRGLFENSDISIWNEDFSQVCETLEELRRDGVTDLRRHLKQNQSLAWDLAAKVTVRDVNEATLKLFGAATRDELAYQIDNTFGQDTIDVFVEELCAIWNGERQFRSETTYRTLGGRDISAIVTFPIPEAREGLKSVPVSIIDTTERKRHIDALERSERALRESERRISAVLGNLPGVAYRCQYDHGWTMEFLSDGVRELTGHHAEDLVGNAKLSYGDVIHADDRDTVRAHIRQAVERDEPFELTYRIITSEGISKWVWEQGRGVFSENGDVCGLEGLIMDVTDRVNAETQLRESQVRIQAIIDASPEGIVLKDVDGRYVLVNRAFCGLLDLSPRDLVGRKTAEVQSPEIAAALEGQDRDVLKTGRSKPLQFELDGPDGSERTYVRSSFPVNDAAGTLLGIGAIYTDITDRIEADAALRESEERYRAIVETATEGVWELDPEGNTLFVNGRMAEMLGYRVEEMIGSRHSTFVDADWRDVAERSLKLRKAGISERCEIKYRHADGHAVWGLCTTSPRFDVDGTFVSSTAMIFDVTLHRRTEQRVRELETDLAHVSRVSQMSELATGFAHELNQPLTVAQTYAQGLVDQFRTGDVPLKETKKLVGRICEQLERASRSISRIREFLRRREPEMGQVDLNEIVRDAATMIRSAALRQNVEIDFRGANTPVIVDGDRILLQQVLINMIHNAIEAMSETDVVDRSISISAAAKGRNKAAIKVRDRGPGINEKYRKKLFETFFTTKSKGLGMGLAICGNIVEGHQGHIRVSNHPAGGAVFEVVLPLSGSQSQNGE